MLAQETRIHVDKAWDALWSSGITNPIVVSDLLGTLMMAGGSAENWEALRTASMRGDGSRIAAQLAQIRQAHAIDSGSEIEAPEFWTGKHDLLGAMNLMGPVVAAQGDILGDIYEHILARLTLAGHFGQFRTPRHIVEFIIEAIDPKDGELVVDPACGSGGFLVAASDYRRRLHRSGSERGIEIDRTILRIGLANTVFHGMKEGNISRGDGLTVDLPVKPDVIVANPPFAGAVIPSVAGRFASGSNRTEILFVESIMNMLADGGRAAVVVPSGVVSGRSASAKYVRRRLVEDNQLEAVVDLPAGVFRPYTDVKTAILVWRNARPSASAQIKMIRVKNDGFSLDAKRRPINSSDLPSALAALRGEDIGGISRNVSGATLANSSYDLNPARFHEIRSLNGEGSVSSEEATEFIRSSVNSLSVKLARIQELISQ